MDGDAGTAGVQPDISLNPAGDVVGLGYINNTAGAASTTAYALDSGTDALEVLTVPNNGTLATVGALGMDTSDIAGLDVPLGGTTNAFALLTAGGVSQLHSVNLTTGAATSLGAVAAAAGGLRDIALSGATAPATPGPAPMTPGPLPTPVVDVAPVLSRVSVSASVFAAASARSSAAGARVPRGTTFRHTLSEAARARVTFDRTLSGRRVGSRCLASTPARRGRARCTRYVAAGSISQAGTAGRNQLRFSGRIGGRALARGSYRATLRATDAGGKRSAARTLSLRVVRP